MKDKLTPVYVVQVASSIPGGIFHKERRDDLGVSEPVPVSENEARSLVAKCEAKGTGARAYHYGWKERGFREGEPNCTELCRNGLWNNEERINK